MLIISCQIWCASLPTFAPPSTEVEPADAHVVGQPIRCRTARSISGCLRTYLEGAQNCRHRVQPRRCFPALGNNSTNRGLEVAGRRSGRASPTVDLSPF